MQEKWHQWQVDVYKTFMVLLLLAAAVPRAMAGPPFLTDDPEPVDYKHYEAYAFGLLDRLGPDYTGFGPAMEFNTGAAPNLQLHVIVPMAFFVSGSGASHFGFGDMELGAKYRFVKEGRYRPQVGTFPMLELPTGNFALGLGNGSLWTKLPIWLQKSFGPWTSYGGGGYAINRQTGMRSYPFYGWEAQRDLNKRLTLGAEIFGQGSIAVAQSGSTILNAGGMFNFNPGFSLLFSAGHTVSGYRQTVGYLGLYWTWGPKKTAKGGTD